MLITENQLRSAIRRSLLENNMLGGLFTSAYIGNKLSQFLAGTPFFAKGHITDGNRKRYLEKLQEFNAHVPDKYRISETLAEGDYWLEPQYNLTFDDLLQDPKLMAISALSLWGFFDPFFITDVMTAGILLSYDNPQYGAAIFTLALPAAFATASKVSGLRRKSIDSVKRDIKDKIDLPKANATIKKLEEINHPNAKELRRKFNKIKAMDKNKQVDALAAFLEKESVKDAIYKASQVRDAAAKEFNNFRKVEIDQSVKAGQKIQPYGPGSTGRVKTGYRKPNPANEWGDDITVMSTLKDEYKQFTYLQEKLPQWTASSGKYYPEINPISYSGRIDKLTSKARGWSDELFNPLLNPKTGKKFKPAEYQMANLTKKGGILMSDYISKYPNGLTFRLQNALDDLKALKNNPTIDLKILKKAENDLFKICNEIITVRRYYTDFQLDFMKANVPHGDAGFHNMFYFPNQAKKGIKVKGKEPIQLFDPRGYKPEDYGMFAGATMDEFRKMANAQKKFKGLFDTAYNGVKSLGYSSKAKELIKMLDKF